jgi:hypothetical protein
MGEAPHEVGHTRFGQIAIANSDSAAAAYTDAAIDQAHRAVQELLVGWLCSKHLGLLRGQLVRPLRRERQSAGAGPVREAGPRRGARRRRGSA